MQMARQYDGPKKYVRNLEQISAWVSPHYRLKERLAALKAVNRRLSESYVAEQALLEFVPRLEFEYGITPTREQPAIRGKRSA